MRSVLGKLVLGLCIASPVWAAIQGKVDEKFKIPVPTEQRKIKIDQEKQFQDGELAVTVLSVERALVGLTVNGGAPTEMANSSPTLFDIGNDRICTVVFLGKVGKRAIVSARCDDASEDLRAAYVAQTEAVPVEVIDPLVLLTETAKGGLTNPYLGDAEAIEKGHELFLANSCNGCHGGNGGGGMGPALSNGVWVYGREDDTLFRLVTLGSDGLQENGYSRIAREKVVGPMPSYEGIIENADDLWKILAFVRSVSPTDAPALK